MANRIYKKVLKEIKVNIKCASPKCRNILTQSEYINAKMRNLPELCTSCLLKSLK